MQFSYIEEQLYHIVKTGYLSLQIVQQTPCTPFPQAKRVRTVGQDAGQVRFTCSQRLYGFNDPNDLQSTVIDSVHGGTSLLSVVRRRFHCVCR